MKAKELDTYMPSNVVHQNMTAEQMRATVRKYLDEGVIVRVAILGGIGWIYKVSDEEDALRGLWIKRHGRGRPNGFYAMEQDKHADGLAIQRIDDEVAIISLPEERMLHELRLRTEKDHD